MKIAPLFIAVATAAAVYCAPVMAADEAPAVKIAVVNIQQVMRDSTAAKSVREQLEGKQKAYQSELSKKDEGLRKEEEELKKQRSVLSKDAFEKKATDFRKKATEIQKEVQAKKASLDAAFEGALAEIQKAVNDVISEQAKEKGYTMVIPTAQLLYADTKFDISADVLTSLNKKLTKVDVKFDKAK